MTTIITIEAPGYYLPEQAQAMIKNLCAQFKVLNVRSKKIKVLPHVPVQFCADLRAANDPIGHDRAMENQNDSRPTLDQIRALRLPPDRPRVDPNPQK